MKFQFNIAIYCKHIANILKKTPGVVARFLWCNLHTVFFYMFLLAIVTLLHWRPDASFSLSLHNFSQGLRSAFLISLSLAILHGLISLLGRSLLANAARRAAGLFSTRIIYTSGRILRGIAWLLTFILAIFSYVEVWISFMLHSRWSDRIIRLIADTNRGESGEFLERYLFTSKSILVTLGFIILTIGVWYGLRRLGGVFRISSNRFVRLCQQWGVILLLCLGGWWWSLPPENNFNAENNFNTLLRLHKMIKVHERSLKNIKALEKTPALADGFIPEGTEPPTRIIWVIGESDSKAHWNLYGYPMPTTPCMNRLEQQGDLLKFEDVICFEPRTYRMMEILFSPYIVTDSSKYYLRQPLTPMIMRKAGYTVRLHDNQATLLRGDDQAEVGTCNFMNSIKLSSANFDYRNDKMYPYDMQLFDAEKNMLKDSTSLTLDIFHINGQHFSAEYRYPEGFGKFSASDYPHRKDMSLEERHQIACYDNATLYVDSLLMKIYREIEGQDAIIIYHPDHGEEMNDERHSHVRTMDSHKIPEAAPYVLEIPFLIITTPGFRSLHPELYARLVKAAAEKQSLIYFSHFLLDVAGIDSKYKRPELSPLSPQWRRPRRVVRDIGDYDVWKTKKRLQ